MTWWIVILLEESRRPLIREGGAKSGSGPGSSIGQAERALRGDREFGVLISLALMLDSVRISSRSSQHLYLPISMGWGRAYQNARCPVAKPARDIDVAENRIPSPLPVPFCSLDSVHIEWMTLRFWFRWGLTRDVYVQSYKHNDIYWTFGFIVKFAHVLIEIASEAWNYCSGQTHMKRAR